MVVRRLIVKVPQSDQQQVVTMCNKTRSSHVLLCAPINASPDPSLNNLSVSLSLCHRRLLYVPACNSQDRQSTGQLPPPYKQGRSVIRYRRLQFGFVSNNADTDRLFSITRASVVEPGLMFYPLSLE